MFGFPSRSPTPEFEFRHDEAPSETLVAGFSGFGLAGLTAVDYLVDQLELDQIGRIQVEDFPAITPFENGTPRHHTRLFSRQDLDVTVLVGELFVPVWAAESFADAILSWGGRHDVEEVVLLSGVPTAHGPDDHRPFYVATPDYQRARLSNVPDTAPSAPGQDAADGGNDGGGADGGDGARADEPFAGLRPMAGGFLDGLNGAIVLRAIDSPLRACVFTTPAHPQTPDVDAALRLLAATDAVYGFDLDTEPLEAFAAEVGRYYEELAARIESSGDETEAMPEDRMYM